MPRKSKTKSARGANKPVVLANNASPRPKQRGAKKKSKNAAPGAARVKPHHVTAVCSITDPFCMASRGTKFPDGSTGNTMPEQFRGNVTVSSNAAGAALFFINIANLPFGYGISTGVVASPLALPATWTTLKAGSMLETYGKQFRIVSGGCVIRSVASATTSAGLITFGAVPAVPINTSITLGTELYSDLIVRAIQPGLEVSWMSQPQGTGARDYVVPGTNTSFLSDWTCLLVELSGCPFNTPMVNIEWFVNCEFQVAATNAISSLCTPAPPAVPVATTAVSKIHSSLGSFIEGGVSQVESAVAKVAKDALGSILSDPLESLAALFGM